MSRIAVNDLLKQVLHDLQVELERANYAKLSPTWKRGKHVIQSNRMYYIIDGEGCVEVNGQLYYPKPGQMVIMPKGVPQSYYTSSVNPYTKYWCHFHAQAGDSDLFSLYNFPICIEVTDKEYVEKLFQQLVQHYKIRGTTSGPMMKASLTELICYFIERALDNLSPETKVSGNRQIHQIIMYMETNLNKKISLEELASQIHYHPNYFSRVFQSNMGVSPIHYLTQMRLEKAKSLLLSTQKKVSEISMEVGLEHNFTTTFKHYTGYSPASYRKMYGISS